MSTRTTIRPTPVITDGDMAGDIESRPTVLQSVTRVAYSYSWTGSSPLGEVSVEVSNDFSLSPAGTVDNQGTWTTIPIQLSDGTVALSAPVSGNTGNGFIDVTTGAYAIRTVYTSTSGTGALQATVVGKVA